MVRSRTGWRWFLLSVLSLGLLLPACGGGGGAEGSTSEVVYLHVFNGYPGTNSLTLYGPTGPIVTNLPFGRMTETPVAVNRNLGTEFMLVLDGAPQEFDLGFDLYSLYPHETATFFIVRRNDTNSAQFNLYRHVRATSPACRLVVDNALSVDNSSVANFNFMVGWEFDRIDIAGYDEDLEEQVLNEIDALIPNLDMDDFKRTPIFSEINAYPYFVLEMSEGIQLDLNGDVRGLQFVWVGPEDYVDLPRVDFEGGTLASHPTTDDFLQCIEDAAADAMDPMNTNPPELDAEAFESCGDQRNYTVTNYRAGGESLRYFYHYYPGTIGNTGDSCNANLRIFSDFGGIFMGEHGYEPGTNKRVDFTADFSIADHYFFILYGNPANPRGAAWKASAAGDEGGGFVELPGYPGE